MIRSRLLPWLLALLVLIGQQGSLLHHLGHDLDAVGDVVATIVAAADAQPDPSGPAEEKHGSCTLCVGFGAGFATAGSLDRSFAAPDFSFSRPLAAVPCLRPCFLRGAPIRGPPGRFSDLA